MYQSKTFTLEEARALLPALKEMLAAAKSELATLEEKVEEKTEIYERSESRIGQTRTASKAAADVSELRLAREDFEQAIAALSQAREEYLNCLTSWFERITDTGVILRDLTTGLMDFPARQGKVEYFLCWRLGEDDINFWHLANDGFIGRRSLAVLSEYF